MGAIESRRCQWPTHKTRNNPWFVLQFAYKLKFVYKCNSCNLSRDYSAFSVALFYWPEGEEDGRAASGGTLAPEPPRVTGVGPDCHWFLSVYCRLYLSLSSVPLLFRFFEIGLHFIVQPQIGGGYELKIKIFGFAAPWRRRKLCPISKKVGGEKEHGMSNLHFFPDIWESLPSWAAELARRVCVALFY